jgi:hypothetical protein
MEIAVVALASLFFGLLFWFMEDIKSPQFKVHEEEKEDDADVRK